MASVKSQSDKTRPAKKKAPASRRTPSPSKPSARRKAHSSGQKATHRDIFLSHRSANKDFVRKLASRLEEESHKDRRLLTWLDEAEIGPGQSIVGMVNQGLENSRFIGIVMTPDYFVSESGWTDAEWHAALHHDPDNRRARLVPILAEDCPYIPYLLRHLRAIDFRGGEFERGLRELLAVLREEPLPRPTTHRGQLISPGGRIDRSTLIAERAVPLADPDAITERLYCNLLPIERLPKYVYTAAISKHLVKSNKKGKETLPSKAQLKEAVRESQEAADIPAAQRYMPAFRVFEDRIITFHDLEALESPLAAVIDENDVEVLNTTDLLRDEALRKILISLMNMALSRHIRKAGLVVDEEKQGRFFFPAKDGEPHQITWVPVRKKAIRTVAKPVMKDDKVHFWRHLGAYIQVVYLVNKFYVKIMPTWVISEDGYKASGGPDIGKKVIKWTGPERNLQVLYHVRFWTSILRGSRGGLISVRAGDHTLEIATVPAQVQQPYGIADDQKDLMRLLDEAAPIIAAKEEQLADIAVEDSLAGGSELEEGVDFEDSEGFEEEFDEGE
jgi:hypothetical protein